MLHYSYQPVKTNKVALNYGDGHQTHLEGSKRSMGPRFDDRITRYFKQATAKGREAA